MTVVQKPWKLVFKGIQIKDKNALLTVLQSLWTIIMLKINYTLKTANRDILYIHDIEF